MPQLDLTALTAALDALPKRFPGPGGVAGVMLEGKVIATRAWGYANLDSAKPMTTDTRLPICSISKQFTCQVLLATLGEPEAYDHRVADYLPKFTGPLPSLRQLCNNQSGLRDYWALTVLQGALAEQPFRREDALPLIARMKTGHFPPGSQYSYCNCNFRIVSEIIESETGRPLDALYAEHIFGPAGMKTAVLTADTSHPEDGVVGYEGTDATGFFPAENAIYWVGDAGISASLGDMLAYEAWIDATRDDAAGLYRRAAAPPRFADGAPAFYGYGLAHETIAGLPFIGHAGALRGFRAQRLNCREARLSVVVMFNHEASPHAAAESLINAGLGHAEPEPAPLPDGWEGQWIGPNGLLARIESGRRKATLRYATSPDTVTLAADGTLAAAGLSLARQGDALVMRRDFDNLTASFAPLATIDHADASGIAGRWHSDELEAEVTVEVRDGGVFARFTGMLGSGRMERMAPVCPDVWIVATRRSMDAPAPGDWTVTVGRDGKGAATFLTLGCWLARGVTYRR
ncbi:D-aminopeptidase [Paragemmobacter straminiformis]|uniref:D-aminopeptidase n=1 Tax=Paragemmobacter straminiformis TaxID=2045119 RepID=A0A842I4L1_9RHOB|nr:D-aminopeptidase [Gemmobacter straminiformis]MBC2834549.1 D-aminopeptidase [Gemmobacter straminiformis]